MKYETKKMIPAEVFPLWSYIHEEMLDRGWDKRDLAVRMGGDAREQSISLHTLEFIEVVRNPDCSIGEETAMRLARAFGVSKELFINLDNSYRVWRRTRDKKAKASR